MNQILTHIKTVVPETDLLRLPEAARRELITFYEFLVFKYLRQETRQSEKQNILEEVFREADGKLPSDYRFDREEIHER